MEGKLIRQTSVCVASASLADWYEDYAMYQAVTKPELYAFVKVGSYNTMGHNWCEPEAKEFIEIPAEDFKEFPTLAHAWAGLRGLQWSKETIDFKNRYGLGFSHLAFLRGETWNMPPGTFPEFPAWPELPAYYLLDRSGEMYWGFIFGDRAVITTAQKAVDSKPLEEFHRTLQFNTALAGPSVRVNGYTYEWIAPPLLPKPEVVHVTPKRVGVFGHLYSLNEKGHWVADGATSWNGYFRFERNGKTYELPNTLYRLPE